MSAQRQGTEIERKLRKELEDHGYEVTRAAASKGPWDLIAMSHLEVLGIQVKKTKSLEYFKKNRASTVRELRFAHAPPAVTRILVIWISRIGWHTLFVSCNGRVSNLEPGLPWVGDGGTV